MGQHIVKAKGSRWKQGNTIFWAQQCGCPYGLTVGLTAGTRPSQAEAKQNPSRKEVGIEHYF